MHQLSLQIDSFGLNGADLVSCVLADSIILSYVRLTQMNAKSEADGKLLIIETSKLFRGFKLACFMLGIPASEGRACELTTRSSILRCIHRLCERRVFEKIDSLVFNEKLRKPQARYSLRLNLLVVDKLELPRSRLYLRPPVVKLVGGGLCYVSKHYASMQRVVRSNKLSTMDSTCSSPDAFNYASSIRYYLDHSLLRQNMELLAAKAGLLLDCEDTSGIADEITKYRQYLKSPATAAAAEEANRAVSALHTLLCLNYFKREAPVEGFYFRYYADFRGRIYVDSDVGPTHNVWARFSITFEGYSEQEITSAKLTNEYAAIFDAFGSDLHAGQLSDFQKLVVVETLMEVGKIFKSEAGGSATRMRFAGIGKRHLNDNISKQSGDAVEFYYLKYVLRYAIAHNQCKAFLFSDATASGMQMLGRVLGTVDEATANKLNLVSTTEWYDTYQIIVDDFLIANDIPDDLRFLFTRKHLKGPIMIVNYNGTPLTCFQKMLSSAGVNPEPSERKRMLAYYMKFHKYICDIFAGNTYYPISAASLLESLGSPAADHFHSWASSKSTARRDAYVALSGSSIISRGEVFKPITVTRHDPEISKSIDRLTRLDDDLESCTPRAAFDKIVRGGLYKDYKRKTVSGISEQEQGDGSKRAVSRPHVSTDEVEHANGVRRVRQAISRMVLKLRSDSDLSQNLKDTGFHIEFPDQFKAAMVYMVDDLRRHDVKSTSTTLAAAAKFIDEHRKCYIKAPEDIKGVDRMTEEVTVLLNAVDPGKTVAALNANLAHACDAYIIREIVRTMGAYGHSVIVIHDCVGTGVLARSDLRAAVRGAYTKLSFSCAGGGRFQAKGQVTGDFIMN